MDVDDALKKVGDFNRLQKLYVLPTLILANIIASWFTCIVIFTLYENKEGDKIHVSSARDDLKMTEFESKSIMAATMIGILLGNVTLGKLSDIHGRKKMTFFLMPLCFITSVLPAVFNTSWKFYWLWRFLAGWVMGGIMICATVLTLELSGNKYWGHLGILAAMVFGAGVYSLSFLAELVNNWRFLHWVTSIPMALLIVLCLFIPESPRWMYSKGQVEKAEEILRNIGKVNRKPKSVLDSIRLKNNNDESLYEVRKSMKNSLFGFLRSGFLFQIAIMMICWFVNSLVYYGITLNSDSLGENIYQNTKYAGLAEMPGYLICMFFMNSKLGKKRTLILLMLICGIFCLTLDYFHAIGKFKLEMSLLAKMMISGTFALIYPFTCEIFPTEMRSISLGCCSMAARVGGILAPFAGQIGKFLIGVDDQNSIFLLYAVLSLSSGILCLKLPADKAKNSRKLVEDAVPLLEASEETT